MVYPSFYVFGGACVTVTGIPHHCSCSFADQVPTTYYSAIAPRPVVRTLHRFWFGFAQRING
jgi:hypothetical protein